MTNIAPVTSSAPLDANDVAKCFIKVANDVIVDVNPHTGEQIPEGVTPLKLQKLLYYAQAAHLALFDRPLFRDDIVAWKFGPVIPAVYHAYKEFGNTPIPGSMGNCESRELEAFTREIWNLFGKYSAAELVHFTHEEKPWKETFDKGGENPIIPQDVMKRFYKQVFVLRNESHPTQAAA